jgi:hypothetical protein
MEAGVVLLTVWSSLVCVADEQHCGGDTSHDVHQLSGELSHKQPQAILAWQSCCCCRGEGRNMQATFTGANTSADPDSSAPILHSQARAVRLSCRLISQA